MRAARLATVAVVILATLLVASAPAATSANAVAAPKNLRGFLLRPNEPVTHTFARTPAFAWSPVRTAMCYELELASSRNFYGNSVVWSNVSPGTRAGKFCRPVVVTAPVAALGEEGSEASSAEPVSTLIPPIKIPAVSVNLVLPWFTGKPYALYARVRAITSRGPTAWGKPFGFNMRWESLPVPMPSKPGLVRWTPVEGAMFYEVWYGGKGPTGFLNKIVQTHTNVADQRDLYTFHLEDFWWSTVNWRVRAVRQVIGSLLNGLPAVSYGPWSPVYSTTNPSWSSGKIVLGAAVSDRTSSSWSPSHQLMPGLTFTGDQSLEGISYRLFRAYAFTDRDCVNVVFRGSVVGSPAFAPRINGPLKLPATQTELDETAFTILPNNATENAKAFTADTFPVTANETIGGDGTLLGIDLPDVDVGTTRYFWTVVPVAILVTPSGEFQYWDVESPQDACQAGRIATFGKESKPAITAGGSPYVSGLSPKGRLLAQAGRKPVVYSTPLVAWKPVVGAMEYEIQWSRKAYPWRTSGSATTFASSTVLNLSPGLWYYRVRGLNRAQIGTAAMTWSAPVTLRVVRPTFQIAG